MFKPVILGPVVTLTLAVTAGAQPPPAIPGPPVPPPQPAPILQAGAYQLAPGHTRVMFSVGHFPLGAYSGQFVGASGTMWFDARDLAFSRLEVRVPIDGVKTGSADFTQDLKGPGWFDAVRFPFMSFRSTVITATGPATADVAGDLTLHGITRPVVFKARWTAGGANPLDKADTTGFEVRGVLKRREFGMTMYEPFVSDDVHITISAAFERAPS